MLTLERRRTEIHCTVARGTNVKRDSFSNSVGVHLLAWRWRRLPAAARGGIGSVGVSSSADASTESQLFSTIARTRRSYSRRLSRNSCAEYELTAELGSGSSKKGLNGNDCRVVTFMRVDRFKYAHKNANKICKICE